MSRRRNRKRKEVNIQQDWIDSPIRSVDGVLLTKTQLIYLDGKGFVDQVVSKWEPVHVYQIPPARDIELNGGGRYEDDDDDGL